MENKYIRVENNTIINEQCIKWVQKMGECLEICTKSNGCNNNNTHKICKNYVNSKSYDKLNKFFELEFENQD